MASKTTCFLYVVAATKDPDNVKGRCQVPYEVDSHTIFFGPCKKLLRKHLIDKVLGKESEVFPEDDFYIVGVNGSNPEKKRKILWCGKIKTVMTYETAYNTLRGGSFEALRNDAISPLQFEPIYDNNTGKLIGYRHCSKHHPTGWEKDVASKAKNIRIQDEEVYDLGNGFDRDCCFTCENIFYARTQGLPITEKMLEEIRQSDDLKNNPKKEKVIPDKENPSYYCFGRRADNSADGFTGKYVTLKGKPAERLIDLIKLNRPKSVPSEKASSPVKNNRGC